MPTMRAMSAVQITWDEFAAWEPEPSWTRDEFETLSEELAELVLRRRLRKLIWRGYEPTEALQLAVRVESPI
jgi:hypothetical protein